MFCYDNPTVGVCVLLTMLVLVLRRVENMFLHYFVGLLLFVRRMMNDHHLATVLTGVWRSLLCRTIDFGACVATVLQDFLNLVLLLLLLVAMKHWERSLVKI